MRPHGPPLLARHLALAYACLVVYASLHPFSGWRDLGLSPFAFLEAGWPRYWSGFDLGVNIAAYLPLGFLLTLAFNRLPNRWLAAILAAILAGLVSLCLESLQTWLPSRVPSNLDLGANSVGGAGGALLAALHGDRFFARVGALQQRLLAPVPHAEFGLVLLGLWLLTQLSPETLLFGDGDLRSLLGLPETMPYAAQSFFVIESVIIACNTVAVGLLARTLLAPRTAPAPLVVFFVVALGVRTLSAAILVSPRDALAWFSPGAGLGMLIGGLLLVFCLLLPLLPRVAIAGLALMAGTVLVNLAPENPYSAIAIAQWRQGHFLNFNGLTRIVAALWPFVALPYLMQLGRRL